MELQSQLQAYCPNLSGDSKFISTWFGKKINSYPEDEYKTSINRIVAEICILNGLETYNEESNFNMYVAQMRVIAKFIYDGFGYLTVEEITNAFHLNLQGKYKDVYKQFGKKEINCEFIGQVLSAYREYKQSYVDMNEDILKIINPPEQHKQIEYKTDVPNDERLMVENEFQKFILDPKWNLKLLFDCVYLRLELDELIPQNLYKKFIKKAKSELVKESQLKKLIPTSKDKVKTQLEDGSIGFIIQKNFDMNISIDSESHQIRNGSRPDVKHYAMQLAVAAYFKKCLEKEINCIYRKA